MAAAFGAAVFVVPRGGFFASLSAFLPRGLRSPACVLAVGILLMLPMILDGGLQLVSAYVSSMPQRILTGSCTASDRPASSSGSPPCSSTAGAKA